MNGQNGTCTTDPEPVEFPRYVEFAPAPPVSVDMNRTAGCGRSENIQAQNGRVAA